MSYENQTNLSAESNLGHNLGKGDTGSGSHSSSPMTMVYTNEQPKHHPQPPVNNQYITYQQTTLEIPRFEYPKFRYDYGWPDYSYTRPLYIEKYPNPYREDDRISQFFIGSVTVVGLFILYRILDKHK
jgi:hypothetical protein